MQEVVPPMPWHDLRQHHQRPAIRILPLQRVEVAQERLDQGPIRRLDDHQLRAASHSDQRSRRLGRRRVVGDVHGQRVGPAMERAKAMASERADQDARLARSPAARPQERCLGPSNAARPPAQGGDSGRGWPTSGPPSSGTRIITSQAPDENLLIATTTTMTPVVMAPSPLMARPHVASRAHDGATSVAPCRSARR